MKKRLNKIPTNYTVALTEQEVINLSETLSAVRTAGGGTGGVYIGDGQYIGVDNNNNRISFLPDAATKLDSVSDKLDKSTYAVDSATFLTAHQSLSGYYQKTETSSNEQLSTEFEKYQTVAGMAEYLTKSNAQTTYLTKSSAEENLAPISVTADVEVLKANSGNFSQYYKKTETSSKEELSAEFNKYQTKADMDSYATDQDVVNLQLNLENLISTKQPKLTFGYDEYNAISSINDSALAGQGGVTGDYYSASNPSGFINSAQAETQILEKHYLQTPSELIEGTQYAYTTQGWSPIQGGGGASGISFVNHDDTLTGDGNTNKLGVDTTKIQTKLTDAQIQNITDVTTLKTASSTWDNVSAKLNTTDFNTYTATTAPATYQPIGNYLSSNALEGYATQQWVGQQGYITQETDWTNTIQVASAKAYNDATANANSLYQTKGDYVKNTDIGLDANSKVTAISGKELIITAHQSLTNYYTKSETSSKNELSTEFAEYLTTAQYNTDSASFALKTDLNDLVSSAGVTTTDTDYVMTTTGWKVLTLPGGGMTQVIHDETLSGQGNANDNKLGVAWSALSGNTIDYSNSAFNLTNGTSVSSFNQISAAIDDRYSKSSSDSRYLQKSLDSTLTGEGKDNKKLGVAWSALSGNTINSAKSASSAEYLTNGTNYSGYNDIVGAINNKLNTNAIKTSAIGNTTYVTAINTGSNDIPVKDTNFWAVNTTASTTAGNDNWQHYVTTSNTFNYYQMIVHPSGTTADNSWNNDNIIHIILEE